MLSWLSSIGDAIGIFVQFITSMISGIVQVFALVAQAMVFMTTLFALVPPVLIVFASAGIAVTVMYFYKINYSVYLY